ncbi:MAG TPA: hypothetical protein VGX21_14435 [Methylomirabilota bacterium]|jgi:predicted CoA-binding protein|nr:hypothetical protein [Methylomirabilota bacterium]
MEAWRAHLLTSPDAIARVVRESRRIAVLGIKPESRAHAPAFFVPAYMAQHGYDAAAAETLARAGIDVVQDRCLMVEHRRLVGPRAA